MIDAGTVRRWLGILHGDSPGHIQIAHTGDWSGATFPTADLDAAAAYVARLDAEGREGIYCRVTSLTNPPEPGRRGGVADSAALPALWADIDLAGPGHAEQDLPPDEDAGRQVVADASLPEPTIWIHSGGGLYPIWLLNQPCPVTTDNLNALKTLAKDWQAVLEHAAATKGWRYGRGVGDLARVLRIPGTVNRKEGLARPCRIIAAAPRRYTVAELMAALATAMAAITPRPDLVERERIFLGAPAPTPRSEGELLVGDDFNARGWSWPDILVPAGWSIHYEQDGTTYYTRPGKPSGISASVNALGTDRLYVFSTSAPPFEAQQSYSKFAAVTVLHYGGDFKKATKALAADGYGSPLPDLGADQDQLLRDILGDDPAKFLDPTPPPEGKVKKKRGSKVPSAYFDDSGSLLVETLANAVLAEWPCALTQEDRVAVYADGVYRINPLALSAAVGRMLGDRFQPKHRSAVTEFIAGHLYTGRQVLHAHATDPLLNVRNGMLDLATGALKPHDPSYLSSTQLPVEWDPDAACPRYEQWLDEMIPEQIEDLEETISTMLDPSRTPQKAVFCFGPSRSGKSTFLRIAGAIAGAENISAVTLHQLSENRFAAANVFGKILNSAADISSAHVDDISIFKMMTGEDPIHADRKYGGQFSFTNRALFAFSANSLPTIGESSRAYVERIKPFEFATSFAGKEDPGVEAAMMAELPGILARWVRAYQRLLARGTRLATLDRVRQDFEVRSDRVHQWVADCCELTGETATGGPETATKLPPPGSLLPPGDVTSRRVLAREFNAWAREQGGKPMGERKIIERLTSINGVVEVRNALDKSRGLNLRVVVGNNWQTRGLVAEVAEMT